MMTSLRQGGRRRGFTLVELLVVVAVIVILTGATVTGLQEYAKRQQFSGAVETTRDRLQTAYSRARDGVNESAHGVMFATTTITLHQGASFDPTDPENHVYALPGGAQVSTLLSPATTSVWFARQTGVPNAVGAITITNLHTGQHATVTISGTGLIE